MLTCPLCGKTATLYNGLATCNALPSTCGYKWEPSTATPGL